MGSDIEIFLQSVSKFCPDLTMAELSRVALKHTCLGLKKKDFFVKSGKTQKVLGFITSGLARSFYVDKDGNERTVGFYAEGDYATHYPAFITGQPSLYDIQCLEPTSFVCLSLEDMQWIYRELPALEKYGRLVAEEILKRQQERIESFIFQTAEERYLDFTKRQKSLFNRISLSHLCSFLGIERQTLTRIRKKIAHQ